MVLSSSLEMILASSRDALALCDADFRVLRLNPPFTELCGYGEDDLQGQPLASIASAESWTEVAAAVAAEGDWQGQFELIKRPGQQGLQQVRRQRMQIQLRRIAPTLGAGPLWLVWVLPIQLALDEAGSIQQDQLTGLPNRALFLDRIDQSLIAAPRAGKSVALLMIGVDRFVLINEGLGRAAGDQVLQVIAQRLADNIRRSDTLARLDGYMFGLVMQIATTGDSVLVAEKILRALNQSISLASQQISVSVSIGISIFPSDGQAREQLLQHAESAMRHQKKQGGNHYQFFAAEMNQAAKSRIELEQDIRQALLNREFVVYYQPKVCLEGNAVVGAEALVRWQRPGVGLVPPGQFIPVAEETGLIGGIGDFVLHQACLQGSDWLRKGLNPVRISVNVTASQFRDPQLLQKVADALAESGMPADYLELEITESMLIGDVEQVISKLNAIRAMGIHISIDDFGTGYSSLSYLSRFPITTLKIDRAFIQDMVSNPRTAEITQAIIGLSRGLDLEVVAEGAESLEHVQLLREQSCDLVQGFFYSRPLPADEFEAILRRGFLYDS
ncbi:MAG: EAL domain-containing protein [Gammaproteobacteria bacterium]|nr:EAL domain-containing protein [Gammaproteobacteria bacterium]